MLLLLLLLPLPLLLALHLRLLLGRSGRLLVGRCLVLPRGFLCRFRSLGVTLAGLLLGVGLLILLRLSLFGIRVLARRPISLGRGPDGLLLILGAGLGLVLGLGRGRSRFLLLVGILAFLLARFVARTFFHARFRLALAPCLIGFGLIVGRLNT